VGAAEIVVTLELGGSGARAHAFDAADRGHLGSSSCAYPAAGKDPGLFAADAWWAAAVVALRLLVEQLGAPAASFAGVTVSAIRIPAVLLDRHGDLAGPSILNTDRRGGLALGELAQAIGADRLYAVTGHWPNAKLGLAKLLWVRARMPAVWRRTSTVLQLHDWFVFCLCGVMASEASSAAMSQLLAIGGGSWASEVLAAAGIDAAMLPELVRAGTPLGRVRGEVSSATGLPAGLPVHAGGGDTHMSALSAAGTSMAPVVVAGTTAPAQVAVAALPSAADRFPLFASAHVIAGRYALEANAGSTAGVLNALQGLDSLRGEELAATLRQRGFDLDPAPDAPLVVLSGNPFFDPASWSSWPRPTIIGLRRSLSGADVYRAGLDGACHAVRGVVETLDAHCSTGSSPLVLTGGMSANPWWSQLLADVCHREVTVRPPGVIAGLAGAVLVTARDADEMVARKTERRFIPSGDPRHDDDYRAYCELYRRAQRRRRNRRTDEVGHRRSVTSVPGPSNRPSKGRTSAAAGTSG
jgi:xylulokinase